ncbi:MAG: hypothetical protein ACRCR1_04875 [Aeromonas sp.]
MAESMDPSCFGVLAMLRLAQKGGCPRFVAKLMVFFMMAAPSVDDESIRRNEIK